MRQRPPFPRINRLAPLAKGLVFAGLGGGAGSVGLVDASGYGNDGTLTNMDPATDWVWAPELGRWALDFKEGDWVLGPMTSVMGTQDYTVAFWFNWRAYASRGFYSLGTFTTNGHQLYTTSGGIVRHYATGGFVDVYAAPGPPLNVWTHCVITRCGTAVSSWWNGIEGLGGTRAGAITYGNTYTIGSTGFAYNLVGSMADFLVWDHRLSPPAIAALRDPSNALLRCGGSSLIREPRPLRSFLGQAGGAPPAGTPWLYCRRSARIVA